MSRLTTAVREKMAVALVHHRFADQAASLVAESQALFHVAYDELYSPADKKLMATLRKSHKKGFATTQLLKVAVNGQRFEVGKGTIASHWKVECELVPVLNDVNQYNFSVHLTADHPAGGRFLAFAVAREKLHEEVKRAYSEALGTLNQFTTGKALQKDWPESLEIIGHLIPEDNRTLPVVQVAELNRAFKLPPKTKEKRA